MMPKFSIVTPTHCWNDYRKMSIARAIKSIENQTFKDFEYIIVNDGSTVEFKVPKWVKLINKQNEERVIAYNTGIKEAQGKIICLLDSDDEYEPEYLERVNGYYNEFKDFKLFNFGCRYVHKDGGENFRGPFKPKRRKVGHEIFGGGNIVNGTFTFHRSVYDSLGAYPEQVIKDIDCTEINYPAFRGQEKPYIRDLWMNTPYDFSAWFQLEFPEQRKFFMVNHEAEPSKIIKELGNPWGQDHALWYKYTRKYHSKPIDDTNLIVHWKQGNE